MSVSGISGQTGQIGQGFEKGEGVLRNSNEVPCGIHRRTRRTAAAAAPPCSRACVEWNLFKVDTYSGMNILDMTMRIHCRLSGILRADRADWAGFSKSER